MRERKQKLISYIEELKRRRWFQEMVEPQITIYLNLERKTMYGCYRYKKREICVFGGGRSAEEIMETLLHELAHHIEWFHVEGFIRERGCMHSRNFWTIYKRIHYDIPLSQVVAGLEPYHPPGWRWKDKERAILEYVKEG